MLVGVPNMSLQPKCMERRTSSTSCCRSVRRFSEEVFCVVCRVRFCCARDRGTHEGKEHSAEDVLEARRHLQMLKETKPLVCTACCQVFLSGLFVNEVCKKPNQSGGNLPRTTKVAHTLICIPEWAVRKYLIPDQRKRSWEKANDVPEINIMIQPVTKDLQENSFTIQKNLQGILSKQRKADLSDRRSRRVTFSPVTAVAFTNRFSTLAARVASGPVDEPLSKLTTGLTAPSIVTSDIPSQAELLPESTGTIASPEEGKFCCSVFSPPLPDENNVSAELCPQMSSTPYSENEARWDTPHNSSSSPALKMDESDLNPSGGIFSSIANTICCALQALPSVVTHLFSLGTHNENGGKIEKLVRRQRQRRSAMFTPYTHRSYAARRQSRKHGQGDAKPISSAIKLLSYSPLEPN